MVVVGPRDPGAGAIAGVAGYFFGSILPVLLGAPEAAG